MFVSDVERCHVSTVVLSENRIDQESSSQPTTIVDTSRDPHEQLIPSPIAPKRKSSRKAPIDLLDMSMDTPRPSTLEQRRESKDKTLSKRLSPSIETEQRTRPLL